MLNIGNNLFMGILNDQITKFMEIMIIDENLPLFLASEVPHYLNSLMKWHGILSHSFYLWTFFPPLNNFS